MQKLKIAVFTDSFFPAGGGTEQATYNLCKNLKELGHEILLFAPDYHRAQDFNEFEVIRIKSIKLSKNDMAVLCKLEYKKILKISKNFNPDIIYYCTASGMAKCAIKVAKKLNKPIVATIHTKFKEAFYNSSHSKLITNLLIGSLVRKLNRTNKIITVSNDMANQLHEYGYKKEVLVIKNGTDHIKSLSKTTNVNKNPNIFTFLFCGHIIKIKNIQFSIKSLGNLKKEFGFHNFKFYIVGEGNYKQKLEKLIKKENLYDNVIFTGFISDRIEISKIYSKADLFLFPSIFDTDGLVICEAASAGTPTLTLKGYGASERITDNKNGFLSNYNVKDFSNRIYQIIQDKTLYNNVCQNVHTIYGEGWRQVAEKYERLFIDLIKHKQ